MILPITRIVKAVIVENGKILMTLRDDRSDYEGYWEIPGGKVEEGESDRVALRREIREELGVEIDVGIEIVEANIERNGPRKIEFYSAKIKSSTPHPLQSKALNWFTADEMFKLNLMPAHRTVLPQIQKYMRNREAVVKPSNENR